MTRRFDAYIAADLVWARLPRGTRRVQMFHGVAGKWHRVYDRPDTSMRQWDRLFFINRKRLQNYIVSGAVERGSPPIRLVGMPKSDCLVDGSRDRDTILARTDWIRRARLSSTPLLGVDSRRSMPWVRRSCEICSTRATTSSSSSTRIRSIRHCSFLAE